MRPVLLSDTVHTDSFTAIIINLSNEGRHVTVKNGKYIDFMKCV